MYLIFQIDFQKCVYASPAIDLAYLIYMIADTDCRQHHRDQLIKSYHNEVVNTLNSLGFLGKIPTLIEIHIEMLKNGYLGKK